MVKSGITREELESWGGKDVFNQGLALCNSGDVTDVRYDDETLTVSGRIQQRGGWAMPVSFTLERANCVRSHCPCAANQRDGRICEHVLAVGIALWVMEAEEDELSAGGGSARPTRGDDASDAADGAPHGDFIEVPMAPKFYAFLSGSRAALSVELDAWYGDIDFPACSVQADRTVYLEDPDDNLVRRTRSLKAEREAVAELAKWGFEPGYRAGDLKLYLTNPQKIMTFLGAGYPKLRRRADWEFQLSDRLSSLMDTFRTIVPVVKVKDAPGGAFDVAYEFDAQGEDVAPAEIQAALNRGDGCLLKGGQVYLLDGDAIERMQGVFTDCAATQGDAAPGWFRVKGVYAPYVRSSLESILDAVDLDDTAAPSWRESAAKRGDPNAKFEPVALGPLDKVLRPYQKQGVYWMRFLEEAGLSGLLADEMGLGKTLQTLTWLSLPTARRTGTRTPTLSPHTPLPSRPPSHPSPLTPHLSLLTPHPSPLTSHPPSPIPHPSLIVCPTSLVRNWEAEAKKFTPQLKVLVISGPERARDFRRIDAADLVVTSYALLQRDFDAAYLGRRFGAVVLDEAQHIKNRETKNAKAVKLLEADRRLALTGTPVENSVADVWSIFDFLMPDYLGDYETFKLNFENPIRESGDAATLAKLKRKIAPFILRRVKKSVAKDLPDKIVKVSYCPMSDDAQREYVAARATARREAGAVVKAKGFAKSKFELLALLMRLRQIAARAKVEPFMEQLSDAVAGGHKILVFSQFVKMLKVLSDELKRAGIPFCYLDGATKDRLGECNRFNRDPKVPVFLISLMAGGTGLNLTGADMVMHYDPWWNPAVEDQATDRAHRIGQKKTVYVMKMIASGTIEEKVLALQRRKQAVISATVSTTDAQVMETLTAADLNELLS